MSMFLKNLLMALIWTWMTGQMSLTNLLLGFFLGYCILWFLQPGKRSSYFGKVRQLLFFSAWFAWELFISNLRVAKAVITPGHDFRPGTIAIPLEDQSSAEVTMLANLITLTPGTLSLDVSDDERTLYIHAMFIDNPESLRREIKNGLEKRLLELTR